ncbi:dicarboxylate/amino acid:cation symporter, partial [Bacillus cereus group sp. Bce039]
VAFAYISTISAGILAFFSGSLILPSLIKESSEVAGNIIEIGPYVNIQIPALMGVMTALATAFLLGLGMASINSKSIYSFTKEFQNIIEKVI